MGPAAIAAMAAPYVMGGLSYLGGQQANDQSAQSAKYATDRSMEDAQKNRDFQANMSNTAHQREVADLEAAGLNPLLSGTGGPGSSTPSGATGNAQASTFDNIAAKGLSSAVEMQNLQMGMAKQGEELKNMQASRGLTQAQTAESLVSAEAKRKDIPKSEAINEAWGVVKPLIKKTKDAINGAARYDKSALERADQRDEALRKAIQQKEEADRRIKLKKKWADRNGGIPLTFENP